MAHYVRWLAAGAALAILLHGSPGRAAEEAPADDAPAATAEAGDKKAEEQKPAAELPDAALDAIKARFKNADVTEQESVTVYKVKIDRKGKQFELYVTADGKLLKEIPAKKKDGKKKKKKGEGKKKKKKGKKKGKKKPEPEGADEVGAAEEK